MTGFIMFENVLLNVSEVRYAMVENKKKADYILRIMIGAEQGVIFHYDSEEEANKSLAELTTLLNLPDGSFTLTDGTNDLTKITSQPSTGYPTTTATGDKR